MMLIPAEFCFLGALDGSYNANVCVVNDRNEVEGRSVNIGQRFDEFVSAVDGLSASDWILVGWIGPKSNAMPSPVGRTIKPEKTTLKPPACALPPEPPVVPVARPVVREVSEYAVHWAD